MAADEHRVVCSRDLVELTAFSSPSLCSSSFSLSTRSDHAPSYLIRRPSPCHLPAGGNYFVTMQGKGSRIARACR